MMGARVETVMKSPATIVDCRQRVNRVILHINQNLDQKCGLDKLAETACFSPYHFLRVFKALMGETPQQYLTRKRMELAGFNLLEKDQRIIDTAFDAGYETHNSFCKVFKNFYGMSPKRFRDNISREWFFKANRFYHPVNGDNIRSRPASSPIPHIKILPQLNMVYLENRGIKNGMFLASAQDSLDQLRQHIVSHNLEKKVKAIVGIYPRKFFGLDDADAFRFKGAIIDQEIESLKDINHFCFPPGKYAIFTHYGPYEFIIQTWNQILLGWLPKSGRLSRGSNLFEIYLSPPSSPIDAWQSSAYLLLPIY